MTGTGDRSRPRAVLPALCATQITSWGIVYAAFPVLNPQITAATGWSATATTAAFSGALLVPALAGIPVGRILDRRGPGAVMATGSVLGVVAVPAIAYAPNLATPRGLHRPRPAGHNARRAPEPAHHIRRTRAAPGPCDHPRPRPRATRTLAARPSGALPMGRQQRLGGTQPTVPDARHHAELFPA